MNNQPPKFSFLPSECEVDLDSAEPLPPGWIETFKKEYESREEEFKKEREMAEIDSIPGLGILLEIERRQSEAIERIRKGDPEAQKEYFNLECWRMRLSHEYKEAVTWLKNRAAKNQKKEK